MRLDQAALAYLGVPFMHQGRNPALGIDCVGLLVCCAADCGLSTEADRADYGKDPANGYLEAQLRAAFGPPVHGDLQPGDVVAIDFKGAIRHVGIIGARDGGLNLIHTNFSVKRVTAAILDDRWRSRVRAVYRPELSA